MIPSYGVGFTSEQETAGRLFNTDASVALRNATIALMNIYHAKVVFFKFILYMWLFYLPVCLCTM